MSLARPRDPYPQLSWSGWGNPKLKPELPETILTLLRDGLGVRHAPGEPSPLETLRIPEPRVGPGAFSGVIGEDNVRGDDESRLRHLRGKSTPDLLRWRAGDVAVVPDLVALPGSHDEVAQLLAVCADRHIAVVPFGGGTSVVGGLEPRAHSFVGLLALDLGRMNALLDLDEESWLARLEPGLRGPQAEALLGERGYTIGHFPQSFEYATLGGFAAARSSGQASAGYGRFDELVVGLRVATPAGQLSLGRAPKSAAGPDLRQLILGSEGALGVITEITVQVRPAPEQRVYEGWRLASFADGLRVMRELVQRGPRPTVLRLSDETETALNLARPTDIGDAGSGGCLAILGYEGTTEDVRTRRTRAEPVLSAAGASVVPDAGEAWERDRYRGPYLRDALLDAGCLVETLETVTFWSGLERLYQAVSGALRDSLTAQGTPPVILCHLSHAYVTGASLYFTVACAETDDPLSQWRTAKAAASDAILAAGGSISHHHGVGTDHLPWYEREIGDLGVGVLRAVKAELDPAGILNPGVLIPIR